MARGWAQADGPKEAHSIDSETGARHAERAHGVRAGGWRCGGAPFVFPTGARCGTLVCLRIPTAAKGARRAHLRAES